jgi:hypothetical protein
MRDNGWKQFRNVKPEEDQVVLLSGIDAEAAGNVARYKQGRFWHMAPSTPPELSPRRAGEAKRIPPDFPRKAGYAASRLLPPYSGYRATLSKMIRTKSLLRTLILAIES